SIHLQLLGLFDAILEDADLSLEVGQLRLGRFGFEIYRLADRQLQSSDGLREPLNNSRVRQVVEELVHDAAGLRNLVYEALNIGASDGLSHTVDAAGKFSAPIGGRLKLARRVNE